MEKGNNNYDDYRTPEQIEAMEVFYNLEENHYYRNLQTARTKQNKKFLNKTLEDRKKVFFKKKAREKRRNEKKKNRKSKYILDKQSRKVKRHPNRLVVYGGVVLKPLKKEPTIFEKDTSHKPKSVLRKKNRP